MRKRVYILVLTGFLLFFSLQTNAMEVVTQETTEIVEELEVEIESEKATVSGGDAITEPEKEVEVQELDLGNYLDKMTVGENQLLSVTVLPMDVSDVVITYSSSNTNVATINGMGRITAVKVGKTIITVTAGEVSQTFELQVIEEKKVQELDLGDYLNKMTVGEKQLLAVTVLPMEANDVNITYSSSNTGIATINGMGRITAVAIGKTKITVTAGGVSQHFELEVSAKEDTTIHVTDIEVGEHESKLELGKTVTLSGTVLPSDATNAAITYTSSNPAIATVSSTGVVKGISKGDVEITLSADGFSKKVPLTVEVTTTGINLNEDYLALKIGNTFQLSATVTPAEANQAITYDSVDSTIATVSKEGVVAAKGTGSTTILVSNGDTSVAVSVIVNESVIYQEKAESNQTEKVDAKAYSLNIYAEEQKNIDSEMLRYLYETKQVLRIIGDGYIVDIDGKDIVNYNNEFSTDIELVEEAGKTSFLLNKGNELCGAVTVYLEESNGRYLYLYNVSKEKYELLNTPDITEFKLTTPGKYQLCETKLKLDKTVIIYTMIGSMILLMIGGGIYIFVKKKYWFW